MDKILKLLRRTREDLELLLLVLSGDLRPEDIDGAVEQFRQLLIERVTAMQAAEFASQPGNQYRWVKDALQLKGEVLE